jgi:hypothetical protein
MNKDEALNLMQDAVEEDNSAEVDWITAAWGDEGLDGEWNLTVKGFVEGEQNVAHRNNERVMVDGPSLPVVVSVGFNEKEGKVRVSVEAAEPDWPED